MPGTLVSAPAAAEGPAAATVVPGWPSRGKRIGEAANPGPPAPGTPVGGERPYGRRPLEERPLMDVDSGGNAGRVYCPVPACPCGDPRRARGWASDATMRPYIDAHLSGALCGEVPAQWLQARGRQRCAVCGLSVSTQHGVHPSCRPAAREAVADPGGVREGDALPLPTFDEIQAGRTPTLRHVPGRARWLWARA